MNRVVALCGLLSVIGMVWHRSTSLVETSHGGRTTAPLRAHHRSLVGTAAIDQRPSDNTSIVELRGTAMGTTWRLRFHALGVDRVAVRVAVVSAIETVEQQMSHWRPESDLSRVNRLHTSAPIPIPGQFAAVLAAADTIHRQSGGALDVTVGPLIDAWGFGALGRSTHLPADDTIARLGRSVGADSIHVDREQDGIYHLRTEYPETRLDLSSVAKGFAIDLVGQSLKKQGVDNFLMELGGELLARGAGASGHGWRVGIEKPIAGTIGVIHAAVTLCDAAIATSGSYRNAFQGEDGTEGPPTFCHIIDPRSGRPVSHRGVSVTVIADRGVDADGWATALMVLGPNEGWEVANRFNLAALLIASVDGQLQTRATNAFLGRTGDLGQPVSDKSSRRQCDADNASQNGSRLR